MHLSPFLALPMEEDELTKTMVDELKYDGRYGIIVLAIALLLLQFEACLTQYTHRYVRRKCYLCIEIVLNTINISINSNEMINSCKYT